MYMLLPNLLIHDPDTLQGQADLVSIVWDWLDRYPVTMSTTQEIVVEKLSNKFGVTRDFAEMYVELWFLSLTRD